MISIALLECLLIGWEELGCECFGRGRQHVCTASLKKKNHHVRYPNSKTKVIHRIIPSMLPNDHGADYDACVEILGAEINNDSEREREKRRCMSKNAIPMPMMQT
jgi:hypothetical protein